MGDIPTFLPWWQVHTVERFRVLNTFNIPVGSVPLRFADAGFHGQGGAPDSEWLPVSFN
ncbi:hypothetical protein GCM10010319_00630 [Streptomyces blastmyceticus]|uniref:Uncharacterized protein n=1 Tax=Streptomyces blastmyceticus TaxID=68180 RepID=A0ABP3FWN7_9ACTN